MPDWEKIAGSILFALILVVISDRLGEILVQKVEMPRTVSPMAPVAPQPVEPEKAGSVKAAAAPPRKCVSCHPFEAGAKHKIGPNLHGVFGRPVASAPGYAYSDALKALSGAWTAERLDAFIESPKTVAPGTKMTFSGVPDSDERTGVIAYLRSLASGP